MNDYIEREKVLAEYDRQHKGPPGGARKIIETFPAADVRPVVFCRDCKYAPIGDKDGNDLEWPFNEFDENPCPYKCLDNWYLHWYSHKPAPDFFCAAGKKEGGKLMYDELVKELRDSAEWADRLALLMGRSEGDAHAPVMRKAADAIEELSKQREYWELEASAQETDKNYLIDENRKLVEAWQNALYFRNNWISVYDRLPPAEKEVYVTDGEYIARANLLDEVFPGDKPCWSYSGLGEITHWCEQIPLPEPPKEEA